MSNSTKIIDYLGSGTHASRPLLPPISASALAFYYETDTKTLFFWNGSAWAAAAATVPTMAGTGLTTWLNQGTATETDSAAGMAMAPGGTDPGTQDMRILYKTAPATPYTVIAKVALQSFTANANSVGIGWTDGTKLHTLILYPVGASNSVCGLACQKWTNATTFSANDASGAQFLPPTVWLGLKDDGTNAIFSYSVDGTNFVQVFSVAKASGFLGASGYSHVGFMINSAGTGMIGTLMSYSD